MEYGVTHTGANFLASEHQHASSASTGAARGQPRYLYGGQAVIEGVMIRGRRFYSVAARRPDGQLTSIVEPLNSLYTGPIRRIPVVRGTIVLAETLVLGIKALMYSGNVTLEKEGEKLGGPAMALTLAFSLTMAIAIFFVAPLFAVNLFDRTVFTGDSATADFLSNIVEGAIRLGLFLAYIWLIGLMPDIRRVFAYHGAEHMTVKAHEANLPLEAPYIRRFSTAHPRCGTAFLLTVMVVAILVFALLGRPDLEWRILSRIVLLPVIAGIAYEVIRFSGLHQHNPFVQLISAPNLLLQKLTTRPPDDNQIEVAIHAMNTVIAADEGLPLPPDASRPAEGMAGA
ncbi:MAG: DUF1385 domain-containing protein [Chloroflexi bacterium]|nr:DUF1385 domain-containing protein [Chloroflexota bacterium]